MNDRVVRIVGGSEEMELQFCNDKETGFEYTAQTSCLTLIRSARICIMSSSSSYPSSPTISLEISSLLRSDDSMSSKGCKTCPELALLEGCECRKESVDCTNLMILERKLVEPFVDVGVNENKQSTESSLELCSVHVSGSVDR